MCAIIARRLKQKIQFFGNREALVRKSRSYVEHGRNFLLDPFQARKLNSVNDMSDFEKPSRQYSIERLIIKN